MTFVTKGRANIAGAVAMMVSWNIVWPGSSFDSPQTMRAAQTIVPRSVRMGSATTFQLLL